MRHNTPEMRFAVSYAPHNNPNKKFFLFADDVVKRPIFHLFSFCKTIFTHFTKFFYLHSIFLDSTRFLNNPKSFLEKSKFE